MWTIGAGVPKAGTRSAERMEADGWDGLLFVDSQNLVGDCFVALGLAAKVTSHLKLGTGVTNPWTRHPAVMASAIATVQAESDGRAVLGIGRGDSALAHLGLAPAPVAMFKRFLEQLQEYLRGEDVLLDESGPLSGSGSHSARGLATLGLADAPKTSRLHWLRPADAKVPVDVAATGPKVIALGALLADRLTFAVGADLSRIAWAIDLARKTRADAGLDPDGMSFGAYVNCVVHPDPDVARELGEGGLASFARFSVMHGTVQGPVDDAQRAVLETIHDAYDMNAHTRAGTPQAAALTTEFADGFGIFGPSDTCASRLADLARAGLDRLVIIGPSMNADRAESAAAARRLTEEVLPAVRAAAG